MDLRDRCMLLLLWRRRISFLLGLLSVMVPAARAQAVLPSLPTPRPWMDTHLSPDRRAAIVLQQMTLDEKISLLHGTGMKNLSPISPLAMYSNGGAGYVVGIPRLGIPDIQMSDAAYGVRASGANGRYSTALPSSLGIRRPHRSRTTRPGLQHGPRRRSQPGPRAAQRTHLRVHGRRPHPRRNHGRPPYPRNPGPARHGRHQALRAQRPGERAQGRKREHRRALTARNRLTRLPDRHPRIPSRRRNVFVQPRPWRLRL